MILPFNKPYLTGKEVHYMYDAVYTGKLSGNGKYTKLCHEFFQQRYSFRKCLLTTSCTDALEMASLLIDIQSGDEVIMPSYTFVSTANAFVLRGAKIIFVDSMPDHPNLDTEIIEEHITERTKAIIPVHYAGMSCNMDKILALAEKYGLFIIEDAAQAIDSFYVREDGKKLPLGSIGHLGAFSFHETKNIISGEGGMLAINDESHVARSEIIWEKGTNRAAFWRGEVDKYGWVDMGSSFLPSEVIAAFLYAQLEHLELIQKRRKHIWKTYYDGLKSLQENGKACLPIIPSYSTNNAHLFFLICNSIEERTQLIVFLKSKGIHAVFHYLSLHKSPYYISKHNGKALPNCDRYSDCLVRLPLFQELKDHEVELIISTILEFYER